LYTVRRDEIRHGRRVVSGRRATAKPRRERGTSGRAGSLLPSLGKHRTLEELAYGDIRRAIVDGSLPPGRRIVPNSLAAAAGVSRIPVLQALRRLESEGFVRITPHKEVVVTEISPEESRERFLLMSTLEALCVREARGKITPALVARLRAAHERILAAKAAGNATRAVAADGEFHRLLWEAARLPRVAQILQNIWDRGEYYRAMMHARRGGFASESLAEHERIVSALEGGDVAEAARAIEEHRMRAMERLDRPH
jgi:DNA-binding GntR family transcriptional regulator